MGFFSFLVRSDPAASPLAGGEIPPELEGLILAHSDDKPRGKSSRRTKSRRRMKNNSRGRRDHNNSCPNLDYNAAEEEDHTNNMSSSTLAIDMSHSSLRSSLRRGNSSSSILLQEAANASFRTGECIESQIEMLQQQNLKSRATMMTRSNSYTIGR